MNVINLRIRQIVSDKLGVDEAAITSETTFYEDLSIDSLDFCEVIVDIEKAFNITIPDEVCAKLKTVGSLIDYVVGQKMGRVQRSVQAV
ncbi:MAG: acyl carrier protein [Mucilaginibacter sp.]